ncbi:unnamed protein product, partial [Phaeothamnion confervicola]
SSYAPGSPLPAAQRPSSGGSIIDRNIHFPTYCCSIVSECWRIICETEGQRSLDRAVAHPNRWGEWSATPSWNLLGSKFCQIPIIEEVVEIAAVGHGRQSPPPPPPVRSAAAAVPANEQGAELSLSLSAGFWRGGGTALRAVAPSVTEYRSASVESGGAATVFVRR